MGESVIIMAIVVGAFFLVVFLFGDFLQFDARFFLSGVCWVMLGLSMVLVVHRKSSAKVSL